jgi:hypothetical protein
MKTKKLDAEAAQKFIEFYKLPKKEFSRLANQGDWKTFLDRCRRYRPRPLYFIVDDFPKIAWVNLEKQLPNSAYKTEYFIFKSFWLFARNIMPKTAKFWRKVEKDISKRAAMEEVKEKAQISEIKKARKSKKVGNSKMSEVLENITLTKV